jgi:hypothetical protein
MVRDLQDRLDQPQVNELTSLFMNFKLRNDLSLKALSEAKDESTKQRQLVKEREASLTSLSKNLEQERSQNLLNIVEFSTGSFFIGFLVSYALNHK